MKKVFLYLTLMAFVVSCSEESLNMTDADVPPSRAVVPNGADTDLFWHWNNVGTRPTVAMVELHMVFTYKGNDIDVVETRYYMTQTAMDIDIDTSKYYNIPTAAVINDNDKCWVMNWSY